MTEGRVVIVNILEGLSRGLTEGVEGSTEGRGEGGVEGGEDGGLEINQVRVLLRQCTVFDPVGPEVP